jgi:hypothetical protein
MSKFASLLSMTIDIFAPTFEDIRNYVIDYHKRKWTYKQIAQELHLSFGTISKILKSEFGSIEDVLEKKSVKKSDESEAYRLFDKNKSLVQVKVPQSTTKVVCIFILAGLCWPLWLIN